MFCSLGFTWPTLPFHSPDDGLFSLSSAVFFSDITNSIRLFFTQSSCYFAFRPQELLDNTAKLREQMAGARALAEREQQEEYLRVKQMEAYERR